jgi:predicted nucleotidyltransferase
MDRRPSVEGLETFLHKLKNRYHLQSVILFGSRARGDWLVHSDYDLIIVSDDFRSLGWHDRIVELLSLWDRNEAIDLIPYTTDEFARKREDSITVQAALREGMELLKKA